MLDQEGFRAASKWNSVADIPDFPFDSFNQLKAAVATGMYDLGIDRGRARELYPLIARSFVAQLVREQVDAIGIWLALASIGSALAERAYTPWVDMEEAVDFQALFQVEYREE